MIQSYGTIKIDETPNNCLSLKELAKLILKEKIKTTQQYSNFAASGKIKGVPIRPDLLYGSDWPGWMNFLNGKTAVPVMHGIKPKKIITPENAQQLPYKSQILIVLYDEPRSIDQLCIYLPHISRSTIRTTLSTMNNVFVGFSEKNNQWRILPRCFDKNNNDDALRCESCNENSVLSGVNQIICMSCGKTKRIKGGRSN